MPSKVWDVPSKSREEWLETTVKVSKKATEAASFSLPAPYNKREKGCLEKDTLKALQAFLREKGFAVCRLQVQGAIQHTGGGDAVLRGSSMTGMPDVIAMKDGKFFMFECKAPGGHLSAIQLSRLKEWQAHGAFACVLVSASKFFTQTEAGWIQGIPVY
jgi:hypothetical protein